MTKEQFETRISAIGSAYSAGNNSKYFNLLDLLWTDLQRAKKSQQRQYQRRIKALTEQD